MKFVNVPSFFLLLTVSISAIAQAPVSPPRGSAERTEPVDPFRIIDNIYYVGPSVHNTSYLITGTDGHILLDTVYDESVPVIIENIKKLGFKPEDIKLILGTHAHSDHVGGHAKMKEMTGARILASAEDKEVIESGGKVDFRKADSRGISGWPPARVDQVIKDGEQIRLGDILLTAHFTPGHTKGCMTFTMVAEEDMQTFDVIFLGGVIIAAEPLLGHPQYPNMAEDFAMSFAKLQSLPVDIYLGGHGYWNNLPDKIQRMKRGEGYKAFIDTGSYRKSVDSWQQDFVDTLIKESKALLN